MVSTGTIGAPLRYPVRTIGMNAPWRWLELGYRDLKAMPGRSLAYGGAIFAASWILTAGLWALGLAAWIPALAGGFLIVAPLLAVGLYGASRDSEIEASALPSLAREARLQFVYLGFLLAFIYLVWLRIAMLLYALFSYGNHGPLTDFIAFALTTPSGLAMIAVGSACGALLAFAAFAVSVVSFPMLVEARVDFATAVLTSIEAVRRNLLPLVLWGWLIALLIGVGVATAFLGLIVVFPMLGYASWHAYRDLVSPSP